MFRRQARDNWRFKGQYSGNHFEDRIISRRADVVWIPRSCYLTPLGYYLWGALKDKCYARDIFLKDNIREAIGEIQLHTIENVLKNLDWLWRLPHGQLRQPFEWNYFPLLTERIELSNKKINLRIYSVVFFLNHFPKKKLFDRRYIYMASVPMII